MLDGVGHGFIDGQHSVSTSSSPVALIGWITGVIDGDSQGFALLLSNLGDIN
jgi:hypothetical protein